MAFRRRFGGFRRHSSGARGSRQVPRWTAQSAEQLLTAAVPNQAVILWTPAATIGAGVYEEEAKLVRIVGRLCLVPLDNGTVLSGPVGMGIIKRGANLGAPVAGAGYDPLVGTELAARDWLGVYNVQVPPQSGPNGYHYERELDIKVQRRFKAEERLELMLMNGTGDDVVVTIDVRILIVIRL